MAEEAGESDSTVPILQSGAGARAPAGTAGGAAAAAAPGDPAVGGLAPARARGQAGEGAALLFGGGCSESELRQLQRQPHPLGLFFRPAAPRLTQPILTELPF